MRHSSVSDLSRNCLKDFRENDALDIEGNIQRQGNSLYFGQVDVTSSDKSTRCALATTFSTRESDSVRNKVLNYRNLSCGLFLFVVGLFGLSGFLPSGMNDVRLFSSKFGKTLLAGINGTNGIFLMLALCLLTVLMVKNSNELTERVRPSLKVLSFMILVSFYTFLNMGKVSEFLYFQF